MEDSQIVALFWDRSEHAIAQAAEKYGSYCYAIAFRILCDRQDAEESVNDTYLGAWNSIPPHHPDVLSAFLGKITRRLSLKKRRDKHADKRGAGEIPLILDELEDCISAPGGVEQELNQEELGRILAGFVKTLPETEKMVFIRRYWYLDPLSALSKRLGFRESKVKSMLYRTRGKLREQLIREGYL